MPAEECLADERLGEVRLVVEPGLPERLVERVQSERLGLGPAARFLVGRFVDGPRPRGPVVIHARIAGPVRTRRLKVLDERLPRRGAEPRLAARRREDPAARLRLERPPDGVPDMIRHRRGVGRGEGLREGALDAQRRYLSRRELGDALQRGGGERLRVDRRAFRAGAVRRQLRGAVRDGRGDILILFTTRADGLRRDRRLAVHKTSNDEAARRLRRVRRQQGPRVYGPSLCAPLSDRPRRSAVEGHLLALPQREGHRRRELLIDNAQRPERRGGGRHLRGPRVDGALCCRVRARGAGLQRLERGPSQLRDDRARAVRGKPRLDGGRHVRTDGVVCRAQPAPLERVARVEAFFFQTDAPQELEPAAPQELVDDNDHEVGPRHGSIQ